MEQFIPNDSTEQDLYKIIQAAKPGDVYCCKRLSKFNIIKDLLVTEKLANITVQLLDDSDYVIRQVSSKRRIDQKRSDYLNDRQLVVVRALEKVLLHCQKEGVNLIGFSDELVAQPAHLDPKDGISPFALDVNTSGVYRGADSLTKSDM